MFGTFIFYLYGTGGVLGTVHWAAILIRVCESDLYTSSYFSVNDRMSPA